MRPHHVKHYKPDYEVGRGEGKHKRPLISKLLDQMYISEKLLWLLLLGKKERIIVMYRDHF